LVCHDAPANRWRSEIPSQMNMNLPTTPASPRWRARPRDPLVAGMGGVVSARSPHTRHGLRSDMRAWRLHGDQSAPMRANIIPTLGAIVEPPVKARTQEALAGGAPWRATRILARRDSGSAADCDLRGSTRPTARPSPAQFDSRSNCQRPIPLLVNYRPEYHH
jgi:hypothetical protein